MKLQSLVDLWNEYGDVLWEPSRHKSTCEGYVYELQEIALYRSLSPFEPKFIDAAIASLRSKGNRNSTINRKMSCLSKLMRKHQRNGCIDRLPEFSKLPEKNGRVRFLSRREQELMVSALAKEDPNFEPLTVFLHQYRCAHWRGIEVDLGGRPRWPGNILGDQGEHATLRSADKDRHRSPCDAGGKKPAWAIRNGDLPAIL